MRITYCVEHACIATSSKPVALLYVIVLFPLSKLNFFSQIAKYAAKLRLLDHGLLDAAEALNDLQQRLSESKDVDNDNEDSADESDSDYIKRINLFVAVQLHRASSSKRDDYKDGVVYQTRKNIITDFLKSCISNSCRNCGG